MLHKSCKIVSNKKVRILGPICVADRVITHEEPVQVSEHNKKSSLIKKTIQWI